MRPRRGPGRTRGLARKSVPYKTAVGVFGVIAVHARVAHTAEAVGCVEFAMTHPQKLPKLPISRQELAMSPFLPVSRFCPFLPLVSAPDSTTGLDSGDAEAQGIPVPRACTRPVRRPAVPRASYQPPPRITRSAAPEGPSGSSTGDCPIVVRVVPVPAPLPDVPVHVVQAEGIRPLLAHRMRLAVRVAARTRHTRPKAAASSPKLYRVVLPARQAYSHSASVGSR